MALKGRASLLNPLWYGASFGIGVVVSSFSDAISLGFVVETENQVLKHLDAHLDQLPEADEPSRTVLNQMRIDEAEHAAHAEEAGGEPLPTGLQCIMKLQSRVMTGAAYYL